ncbi:nuclear pore complex protein NUP88 [Humulus lupulus]|uniref:nuclear pore complex protein NUP88 n=1 Tax=Humulus lupulus TaxID=3486 RepID=UPI002B410D2A|nr:nuclear pore complex protein NUP88 [Humulus lupulus]
MRFNFEFEEKKTDQGSSSTPKNEVEWVPLKAHPVFTAAAVPAHGSNFGPAPTNLLAWDGASRLYFWDSEQLCLHRISLRLGDPEPTSVLAASPSKVLRPDVELGFVLHKISINRSGSALLLFGSDALSVMYLYGRGSSKDDAIICRTVSVGSQIYSNGSSVIRVLQVLWHPYSDTHLGILSSDSVFRIFDLSSNIIQPEQEYYLQPLEPGRQRNATSICAVDFSFGGDHLWDRFSVFILFSDGSVYTLCPVVPFGSVYKWESIMEIYSDAHTFGLKSAYPVAVSNSNLAISWLEATFPDLTNQTSEGMDLSTLRARPFALFDASLSLQGPLRKVCHEAEEGLSIRGAECEGRAVSLLYNIVSKDSILVTAWSGGQLQIDALADEIQPVWNVGSPSRLRVDFHDHIVGLAMICESNQSNHSTVKLDQSLENTVWLGHPPPLLRLAIVDLALPTKAESGSTITMFFDPLMPERIYCLHDGGIDSVVLHFLPFTSQISDKNEVGRTPSVHPILSTCQGETSSPSPLCGFVSLSDSFGYSWIVGVTISRECVVLEMKTWNLLLPIHVDNENKCTELNETEMPDIISKELLSGPKVVLMPQTSNLGSVAADSIEGRSTLHQYFKLFHENYVEYAHKVYFELKHHGLHLKRIIDNQHARLGEAHDKILKVEEKQLTLEEKLVHAMHQHNLLEERLNRLRNLPGAHKKPLSRAERDFKSELDQFRGVELDALHSSISALTARLRKHTQSLKGNASEQRKMISGRKNVQDTQVSLLKSSLEKLSLVNSENSEKVKLVESVLKGRESGS